MTPDSPRTEALRCRRCHQLIHPEDEENHSCPGPVVLTYAGDAFQVLPTLPRRSYDLVLTSPPEWPSRRQTAPSALGVEHTLEAYVARLGHLAKLCARVLRLNTGILCLILQETPDVLDALAPSLIRARFRVLARYHWSHGDGTASWVLFLAFNGRARLNHKARAWASEEWAIPWDANDEAYGWHEFPQAIVDNCVELALPYGGLILDPFIGKGRALSALPEQYDVIGIDLQ